MNLVNCTMEKKSFWHHHLNHELQAWQEVPLRQKDLSTN